METFGRSSSSENCFCEAMISGRNEDEIQELHASTLPLGENLNLPLDDIVSLVSPDSGVADLGMCSDLFSQLQQFQQSVPTPSPSYPIAVVPDAAVEMDSTVFADLVPVPPDLVQNMIATSSVHENPNLGSYPLMSQNNHNDDGILVAIKIEPPTFPQSASRTESHEEFMGSSLSACNNGSGGSNNNTNSKKKMPQNKDQTRPRARKCTSKKTKVVSPTKPKKVPLYCLTVDDCGNNADLERQVKRAKNTKEFHETRKRKLEAAERILGLLRKYPALQPVLNENPNENMLMNMHFPHLL